MCFIRRHNLTVSPLRRPWNAASSTGRRTECPPARRVPRARDFGGLLDGVIGQAASIAASTPRPAVSLLIRATGFSRSQLMATAPYRWASFSRQGNLSVMKTGSAPASLAICRMNSPMESAPSIATFWARATSPGQPREGHAQRLQQSPLVSLMAGGIGNSIAPASASTRTNSRRAGGCCKSGVPAKVGMPLLAKIAAQAGWAGSTATRVPVSAAGRCHPAHPLRLAGTTPANSCPRMSGEVAVSPLILGHEFAGVVHQARQMRWMATAGGWSQARRSR